MAIYISLLKESTLEINRKPTRENKIFKNNKNINKVVITVNTRWII